MTISSCTVWLWKKQEVKFYSDQYPSIIKCDHICSQCSLLYEKLNMPHKLGTTAKCMTEEKSVIQTSYFYGWGNYPLKGCRTNQCQLYKWAAARMKVYKQFSEFWTLIISHCMTTIFSVCHPWISGYWECDTVRMAQL